MLPLRETGFARPLDGSGQRVLGYSPAGCGRCRTVVNRCRAAYFLPKRRRRVVANSVAEAANMAPMTSANSELEFIPVTPAG